jgi:putative selenium metabolism hydrolase
MRRDMRDIPAFEPVIESCQSELNSLLQSLIRIRSYSGREKEIVEFILSRMGEYGFDEAYADGLGNAVGRIGSGPIKILFDAHVDTVTATEDESWRHPPFAGVIENARIFGRGAVDEKPAMAGYLIAGKVIREHVGTRDLPFTLYVVGSVLEEDCDGYPLLHLIEKEGIRPDYVLLGEPTDLRVHRGQRGRMEIEITVHGRSAHGAHSEQGVSAINKMIPVLVAIEKLDRELPHVAPLGKGSLTTSEIISRAPSLCSVPDFCRIHIDRRLTGNETRESALAQLKEILRHAGIDGEIIIPDYSGTSWKGASVRQQAYFPTWMVEEDHPLVKAGVRTAAQITGEPQTTSFWSFSTNGVATAGRLGIPTIGFAPGREELAHSSREELALADLLTATQFYAAFPFTLIETLQAIG